ncbi:MAG: hypothetical protein ACU0CT_09080 [Paracoccaceae bacterium]
MGRILLQASEAGRIRREHHVFLHRFNGGILRQKWWHVQAQHAVHGARRLDGGLPEWRADGHPALTEPA